MSEDINITLKRWQFREMCQAIADANRVLYRLKRGRKGSYIVALGALGVQWKCIKNNISHYPRKFQSVFEQLDQAMRKVEGMAEDMPEADFAFAFGQIYRTVDWELIPALGADNAEYLRAMVLARVSELAKP